MTAMLFKRLLVLAALTFAGGAHALCYIQTSAVPFGTYQAAQATNLDISFNLSFQCDKYNEKFQVTFSGGSNGTPSARAMSNGTDRLTYQLYTDAARTTPITSAQLYQKADNKPTPDVYTYYGRVPANQDVSPGVYTDTIILNLTP